MPGVAELIEQIASSLHKLDYRQAPAEESLILPSAVDPSRRSFLAQVTYQHLGAYMKALDLDFEVFE